MSDRHRLPANTRLGSARLLVTDLDRSTSYYQRVLGLHVLGRDAASASLGAVDATHPVLCLESRSSVQRPGRARLGLYHFALLVPDRAGLGRFVAHLGDVGVRLASADHAVSEAIYLWDPDGLGIEVYADRPRSTWKKSGDELHMVSEPLDLKSLAAAAEGTHWTGIPRGTVLGHMHLHVNDLDRAAAFYEIALGFERTNWSYPGALFMSAGGYHHHLATNTWARGATPRAEHEAGLLEWEIVVNGADAAAIARHLDAQGFTPSASLDGYSVRDPWGTTLRLVSAAPALAEAHA